MKASGQLQYAHRPRLNRGLSGFIGYKKHITLFIMFVPAIIYFALFKYVPMYGVTIAFKEFSLAKGILNSPWIGFENFKNLMNNSLFLRALKNTLIISLLKWMVGFPAPIIFALLLNEIRNAWLKKTVQTISYLPHFLSWIVLSGIFTTLLSPSNGAVNYIIKALGGEPIYFLASNIWFRPVLVLTGFWKGVGWGTIIYLAAISGISPEMYEAAHCDGATRFQKMIYITLPSIAPIITIQLILSTGNLLEAGFDQVFNLYNEAVYETADIIDTYIYRNGLQKMMYAESTAVGLFKNVIGFILVVGTNAVAKQINEYGLW
jgi:putative aldouronate transport system permease protein